MTDARLGLAREEPPGLSLGRRWTDGALYGLVADEL